MTRLLAALLLFLGTAGADELPRGRPAERPRATRVVVRAADLDAQGVVARVAAGVPVATAVTRTPPAGKVSVKLAGAAELEGKIAGAALGARVLRDVELRDVRTKGVVGKARAGALVLVIAQGPGKEDATIEPMDGVVGRFLVPASALGADPAELVLPVPEGRLGAARAPVPLRAGAGARAPVVANLETGARLDVLAKSGDGAFLRARTYGALAVEGWLPASSVTDSAPPVADAASKGLRPTHEALVDVPAYADKDGKRPIGSLRGGALVSAGAETSGPLVKIMTHGDVVAEIWVPKAQLRQLDASVWAEAP